VTAPATSPTGLGRVVLRPATDADLEFLLTVYGAAREEELSQVAWAPGQREAFLRMQFDAQHGEYHRLNPAASFDVIEVDGVPAGRLYVDRRPGDVRIIDIALLPGFRGSGVGAFLIRRLQAEAARSGCRLSIHVELHNRAAGLYARLGFVVVDEHGLYRRMEWSAS
jgi:ribosomal protein S18 acetylase RimI-like enzyme